MAYRTIFLKDNDGSNKKEALASGTVTPGMLLERTNASTLTVKAHSQAGRKVGPVLVAIEDEDQGNGVTDDYATTKRVFFKALKSGDEAAMLCANGQNIAIGDALVSNGNGYLKKATKDSSGTVVEDQVIATALEAIDFSDSSGADPSSALFAVEIA